jgi:8-oxo-dGTP pyrophosphatase MutT (NUDIX family)
MDNPWKTLSRRMIYDNPWISVREEDVIRPDGSPGLYGVVSFKNLAIGIIPLDGEMHTWLVGQHRYTLNAWSWEIPMGGSPLPEAPLDGARRELREETGLRAARWTEIMRLHTSNSVTDELGIVYLAEDLTAGEPEFDAGEVLEIRRLPLFEAVAMVQRGEITDAISAAGLLMVERRLNGTAAARP